jgi:methionine-rich copper-binding protein CopC
MFRLAIVPCALALVLLFGVADASAHVTLVSTNPKKNARLTHVPSSVLLTFSESLRSGTLSVTRSGARVSSGSGGRDPRNINRLVVRLRHGLKSGRYTVHASTVAPDGDHQSWTYSFTVRK